MPYRPNIFDNINIRLTINTIPLRNDSTEAALAFPTDWKNTETNILYAIKGITKKMYRFACIAISISSGLVRLNSITISLTNTVHITAIITEAIRPDLIAR